MKIHFLPTVWSDMEIIEKDGRFALIDTAGGPWHDEMIRKHFSALGIKKIDFILLTHFHPDHYGCLEMILREYDVDTVYFKSYSGVTKTDGDGADAGDEARAAELERCRSLREYCAAHSHTVDVEGLCEIPFSDVTLKLYNSENTIKAVFEDEDGGCAGQYICNENQNSLMAYFEVYGRTVLLAGDMTDLPFPHPAINMMNTRFAHKIGKHIDVLKAPHHGYGIGSPEALTIYSPSFVYITNNEGTVRDNTKTLDDIKAASPEADVRFASSGGVTVTISPDGSITKEELTV